jgi:hypothetical protein
MPYNPSYSLHHKREYKWIWTHNNLSNPVRSEWTFQVNLYKHMTPMNAKSIWRSSNSEDLGLDTNMIQCWSFSNCITSDKPTICEVHQNLPHFAYHVKLQAPSMNHNLHFHHNLTIRKKWNSLPTGAPIWNVISVFSTLSGRQGLG